MFTLREARSAVAGARRRTSRHSVVELRLTFLAIAAFYAGTPVLQNLTSADDTWLTRLGVLVGFLLIIAAWLSAFSRGGYSAALDGMVIAGLAIFILAAKNRVTAADVLYMCAIMRPLYGESARRIGAMTVLVLLTYLGAMVASTGSHDVTQFLTEMIGVFLVTGMVRLMERSLTAAHDGAVRQRLLARVGADLLAAEDYGRVFQLLQAAVLDVGVDLPQVRVAMTLVPDVAGSTTSSHYFPLTIAGSPRSVRVDTSATSIPASVAETVEALTAQASLALDRIFTSKRWSTLVHNSSDMIVVVEETGEITYVSPAAKRMLGYEVDDLQGRPLAGLLDETEAAEVMSALHPHSDAAASSRLQFKMRHLNDSWVDIEAEHTDLRGAGVSGLVLNCRDVTETKALENQLRHRAFHDSLTSLPNRALFQDRVEHSLAARGRAAGGVALIFVDLDDFKNVNDSLGHASGDQLLRLVGDRIRRCLRGGDTAARLGGDEFAILLDNATTEEAVRVAERILAALDAPVVLEGRDVFVSCSAGIAVDANRTSGAGDLLRDADVAMYAAKANGKARYQIYESGMRVGAVDKLELEAEIRRAIKKNEFELYYQPVVALETSKPVGFEALIRWHHPTQGLLVPNAFIAVAEQSGQIIALDRWVLAQAVRQSAEWELACGETTPWISVNVSAHHLLHCSLADDVQRTLEEHGVAPRRLILEITEGLAVEGTEAVERIRELRLLGVRLALDDFGTGYSSLGFLDNLPVDIIKVDRSFVAAKSAKGYTLLRGIIALGSTLEKQVIVEGVENPWQLAAVRESGEGLLAQGFLLGKPMPAASAGRLLGADVAALATA